MKRRILLAEDNLINQKVAAGILGKLGFPVDIVCNGKEAVTALESVAYALVFMDCHMPEMDGYEAAAAIRSPESKVINSQVPIVALTADAMEKDRQKAFDSGMNDYLAKPIIPEDLERILTTWLGSMPDTESRNKNNLETALIQDPEKDGSLSEPSSKVFDYPALLDRLMGDTQMADDLLEMFLQDLKDQVQQLRDVLERGDTTSVAGQAHKIKGAAGNMGAMALEEIALAMETAARAKDTEELNRLEPAFMSCYQKVRNAIKERIV